MKSGGRSRPICDWAIVLTALLLSTENEQIVTLILLIVFGAVVLGGIRLAQRW